MTECYQTSLDFPRVKRRQVEAEFSGGDISSDGGCLLLSRADKTVGLTQAISRALGDSRRQASCSHDVKSLIRQRIYGLALGYEDLNDHDRLRHDPAVQTAVGKLDALASSPTLCRLEQRTDRTSAVALHKVLLDQFVASFDKAPKRLILDFDATDDPTHGEQEGRFFHGYYDHYCFLPLYVFCGRHLLVSYLRPSKIDPAKHAWAILSLLVKHLRATWPGVQIIFRGDSGFCRWKMLRWCDRHDVRYIVGLARNKRLEKTAKPYLDLAQQQFDLRQTKQKHFHELHYAARSWDRPRRVILKAEVSALGKNPRFVVTNLPQTGKHLYENVYCARGEMENRIKDQQLGLFADRTSCHRWWPNQFRVLLSGLAYTLMEALRRLALEDTELATAQPNTIRLKLFKVGAVILRNTRRIRFLLSSNYPHRALFTQVASALNSS